MATFDVLLPVRDGASYLAKAIESIRLQTWSDWRLLILDHGSVDRSMELANRYAELDKRIELYSFPQADDLAQLLNFGLARCDSKYVLRQDADDISLPMRMSVISQKFDENPNFLALGGDVITIDDFGRHIGYVRVPTDPKAVKAASFFYNPILHPAVTINFAACQQYGALYGRDIVGSAAAADSLSVRRLAEDYFLFGQLALLGSCANVGVPLVQYRRHSQSVGITSRVSQIEVALRVSRFLAKSFCAMNNVPDFDPGPFCNHADYVFDFELADFSREFGQMAAALRRILGPSCELERELAFRWILATRHSAKMAARYVQFRFAHSATLSETLTVRNWLLRKVRNGKYVYRAVMQVDTSRETA